MAWEEEEEEWEEEVTEGRKGQALGPHAFRALQTRIPMTV